MHGLVAYVLDLLPECESLTAYEVAALFHDSIRPPSFATLSRTLEVMVALGYLVKEPSGYRRKARYSKVRHVTLQAVAAC